MEAVRNYQACIELFDSTAEETNTSCPKQLHRHIDHLARKNVLDRLRVSDGLSA
jgi:hypothetical protein